MRHFYPLSNSGLRILLACILLFMSSFGLMAQRTVTGKLTDATDGSPLIGASVFIKGTTQGTVTNLDGEYSLQVSGPEDVIVFQYLGYITREVRVGDQTTIDVALAPDVEELEEVVVIGYGTVKKEDLTGAVAVVSSEDVEKSNLTSLSKALQGKASGVLISNTSGRPGSGVSIRIRGVGSINRSGQPLIVVDGIPGGGSLDELHPEDIESIQILKDASATAIYGADGSNGVILVETKKGSQTKPQVSFRGNVGFSNIPQMKDIMNADEYTQFYEEAYDYFNATHPLTQTDMPPAYTDERRAEFGYVDTDWQDLITVENAMSQNYYLGVSGGNEQATYRISGNYVDEEGILITTWRELFTLKVNSDLKIGDKIRLGETFSYTQRKGRNENPGQGNPWLMSAIASPLMPVYNDTAKGGFQGPDEYITGRNERTNTYGELNLREQLYEGNTFNASLYGEYDIFKGLTFKTTLGIIFSDGRNTNWLPRYELAQRSNPEASLQESSNRYRKYVWDQQLTYSNTFGKHNITATAVHSMQDAFSNSISGTARGFEREYLRTLRNGNPENAAVQQWKTPDRFDSYLARMIYDYDSKYFLTASIRRDGSSRFGESYRWGNFPSFSLAWKINEDFFQNVGWLNMLKLRAGWGQTGNSNIGTFVYDATISTATEHVYTLGLDQHPVFGAAPFYNIPSPNVKWEASTMINVGTDMSMFGNKLQFSGEYYYKKQDELLVQLPLPLLSGMSGDATPPWVNLGEIHNTGVEFNLMYKENIGDFSFDINANFTTIKNVVDYLPAGNIIRDYNTAIVGNSIGAIYGYVAERILQLDDFELDENGNPIQDPENQQYFIKGPKQEDLTAPGDIKFKDLNKDGIVNESDRTIIGKVIPDFTYGLNINAYYKGFDLNVFFTGIQNIDVYNQYRSRAGLASGDNTSKDENKLKIVQNYWTPENPINDQTRISITDENFNGRTSSWWIEDASFLRLKDITLGYTLPQRLTNAMGIGSLRFYAGAVNLLTLTQYKGYDPEVASTDILNTNIDQGTYPVPRTFLFGVTADF